jgi:Zn-dependent peptidase ImmA (M78 family)/transcriptional regulator with XRE-family HTH domain
MDTQFNGAALRLARLFGGMTLEDVALKIGKSRQYLHKLETAQSPPTAQLLAELATALRVEPGFFGGTRAGTLAEEQVHFRKLSGTRVGIRQMAIARAEMTGLLVACLERRVKLPPVRLPLVSDAKTTEDVEQAAELCRREWDLGLGPIADMTRLAEHVGAVVTSFQSVSTEIDAMSFAMGRPIIVRNEAKRSAARQRFDIGHELAHAVLHSGRPTGDHATESEAHRFASALLVPRSMMMKLFPQSRGSRLDWIGLSDFKMTWGISKAALLYRARQLEILTDQQYRTGVITMKRSSGEATREREDDHMPLETPTLLRGAFDLLAKRKGLFGGEIAKELQVSFEMLEDLVGFHLPRPDTPNPAPRPELRLVA